MTLKIGLWILRIFATVLIASLLSIWTTSYVVTTYVQALLEEYEIPLEVKPVALSSVWGMLWGAEPDQSNQEQLVEAEDEQLADPSNSLQQPDPAQSAVNSGNDSEEHEQDYIAGTEDLFSDEPHMDSSDDINLESDEFTEPSQEVFAPIETGVAPSITPDEFNASKDRLDQEEKERMFELMMGKLPPESWQVFSSAIEDGLTEQELLDIQQLMALHLTKEEYNELMELLNKF